MRDDGYYHQHLRPVTIDHAQVDLAAALVRRLGWHISAYCCRVERWKYCYRLTAPGYRPTFISFN